MNGVRHELPHNTPEQVRGYLADALDLVAELDPPSDLREQAFVLACNLLSAKQITIEAVQPLSGALAVPRGL